MSRLLSRGGRLRARLARMIPPALSVRLRAYLHRLCREPEIAMLHRLCDRRRISLDIGANRGQFAYFLGRYSSDVVCFEPQPQLASYLRQSLGGAASVRQCALSDTTGRGTLHIPTIDGERENDGLASLVQFDDRPTKRIDVAVRRLDDFGLSDVGFMKIDVEGMETAVLRGGMRLIERERPALLVESREAAFERRARFGVRAVGPDRLSRLLLARRTLASGLRVQRRRAPERAQHARHAWPVEWLLHQ